MQKRWYARVGYVIGGIVGLLLFVGLWIYCIATYGFLSGVGLGWLPAAIVAVIIGLLLRFLWGPLLFLVAIGAGWLARPDLVPTFDTLGILFSVLGVWVVWGVIQQRRERRQQESDDFPEYRPPPPKGEDQVSWVVSADGRCWRASDDAFDRLQEELASVGPRQDKTRQSEGADWAKPQQRSGKRGAHMKTIAIATLVVLAAALAFIQWPQQSPKQPQQQPPPQRTVKQSLQQIMRFDVEHTTGPVAIALGVHWEIWADGVIDDDAPRRFAELISTNHIPDGSSVHLNSPGGDLFAGMKLGRLIRDHRFATEIDIKADNQFGYKPGSCLSACALTFLGGQFRYLSQGTYGVHQFYPLAPDATDSDRAQIVSAAVVQYIRDMGVDTQLFTEMTEAGKDEMLVIPESRLSALGVVNDGETKTTWSIESFPQGLLPQKATRYCFGHTEVYTRVRTSQPPWNACHV